MNAPVVCDILYKSTGTFQLERVIGRDYHIYVTQFTSNSDYQLLGEYLVAFGVPGYRYIIELRSPSSALTSFAVSDDGIVTATFSEVSFYRLRITRA